MKDYPLLIPILLVLFVSLGLARIKTIAVVVLFSLFFVYGYKKGENFGTPRREIKVRDEILEIALLISLLLVVYQILELWQIPLLNPSIRTHLNPKITMLTYLLGLPSSVYLTIKGRKIGLLYPLAVSLYAYRTPLLASIIALALPFLEKRREDSGTIIALGGLGIALLFAISYLRGDLSFITRVVGTTSVLDVIVKRCSVTGFYKGELQLAGINSYLTGGPGARILIAKYLGISGVTITATLIGGPYLDFGLLATIEMLLLGFYYGITKRLKSEVGRAFYYSTLAYGIVGVETGILDLPIYLMFLIGGIIAWRELDGEVRKTVLGTIARIFRTGDHR
ncbi:hypothetical protein PNA2_0626 [Pyrococcus sp. NA2]|uniref:oligosaccharide repeat unit polymerase family protein n=1 Tax=Pyrococcus sp. (strain NA2) TaxID=342949 RepID=UPI000209AC38|nr:hypothetical protein [Pyrococcus sp. NA2]AEC51542.1 hypothetical protein PNA2_0626 [Pyrococcus sp. NA2]